MDTFSKKNSTTMSTLVNTNSSTDKSTNVDSINTCNSDNSKSEPNKSEPNTKGTTSNKKMPVLNEKGSFITQSRITSVAPNGAFWANDGYDDYYFDENGDEC
tara:strand:+ start:67 stop:372 length:306 start_codon:yes stop_codon:yes gene_type:complete